jgi:hypothetical protein
MGGEMSAREGEIELGQAAEIWTPTSFKKIGAFYLPSSKKFPVSLTFVSKGHC